MINLIGLDQNAHRLSFQARHQVDEVVLPRLAQLPGVQPGVLVVNPVHPSQEVDLVLRGTEGNYDADEVCGEVAADHIIDQWRCSPRTRPRRLQLQLRQLPGASSNPAVNVRG